MSTAETEGISTTHNALDLLRQDEIDEVLRQLSEQPSRPGWARLMNTNDLATLSQCGGLLTAAAQCRLTALMLVLAEDGDAEKLRSIFTTLGPFCEELEMVAFRVPGSSPAIWHSSYAQHCTSLRKLSLTLGADAPSIDSFLAPTGNTLKDLKVECNSSFAGALYSSVSRHCRVLEALKLDVGFRNAPGLSKMLWTIGGTLIHLTLCVRDAMIPLDVRDTEGLNLPAIARQCPKLSELQLLNDLKGARGSAEMLVLMLGTRLRRLTLPYLGLRTNYLDRVVELCPNAKFDTNVTLPGLRPNDFLHGERANPAPTMRVLGKQLEVFDFRDGFRRTESLANDAAAASSIRSLTIHEIRGGGSLLIRDVFSQPRVTLKELKLTFRIAPVRLMAESLRIVACNTGSLESLAILGPHVERETLELFTSTNFTLNSVIVARNSPPPPMSKLDAVLGVIDSFNDAKHLRSLTINDMYGVKWRWASQHVQMRRRYRMLRERRVHLTVDDVMCVK